MAGERERERERKERRMIHTKQRSNDWIKASAISNSVDEPLPESEKNVFFLCACLDVLSMYDH